MQACVANRHQVQGTLRMVELYGAAMVAEEMEQLATALLGDGVGNRDEAYGAALAEWVAHVVEDTEESALVLFTRYRSMKQLALAMEDFFASRNMNLPVHDKDYPRTRRPEQFKSTRHSILYTTATL